MLEQRRDFLGREQVDFRLRKMGAQGPERGRQQHGVAEVFELQGEDFFGRRHGWEINALRASERVLGKGLMTNA